jgi:hypothetical protein
MNSARFVRGRGSRTAILPLGMQIRDVTSPGRVGEAEFVRTCPLSTRLVCIKVRHKHSTDAAHQHARSCDAPDLAAGRGAEDAIYTSFTRIHLATCISAGKR